MLGESNINFNRRFWFFFEKSIKFPKMSIKNFNIKYLKPWKFLFKKNKRTTQSPGEDREVSLHTISSVIDIGRDTHIRGVGRSTL